MTTLNDLIIGEEKRHSWCVTKYVDSVKLEEAIKLGQITELDLMDRNRYLNLNEDIARYKKQLAETNRSDWEKESCKTTILTMEAMISARPGYIVTHDNTQFSILGDKNNVLNDFTAWLTNRNATISSRKNQPLKIEDLTTTLHSISSEEAGMIAHIDISLDYPALLHGMLLKSSFDSNGKFQLPLLYSSWVTPAEGKMGCNADFLSALKVANYFKGRGHGIELQLSHQNSEYIAR